MRNMETLARTLAYLVIGLLTLMAIIFVVLARELILAARQLKRWLSPADLSPRRPRVHSLESPPADAPLSDSVIPLLPAALLPGRDD